MAVDQPFQETPVEGWRAADLVVLSARTHGVPFIHHLYSISRKSRPSDRAAAGQTV